MARFLADENFPHPVIEELRRLGHDVRTIQESSGAGMADDAVLRAATTDDRAVLTLNRRHFIRLHGVTERHSGILACTFDLEFAAQADRIHAAIAGKDLHGLLLRVNRPR